jgi:hypothetical protein
MMDPMPATNVYFGPNDVADISTHRQWWNCYFEDCTFAGDATPEQVFWRCNFSGRAYEWLKRQMSAENERLREALERISHPDPDSAPFLSWNDAEEIAREALRVDDNPDTKGGY